jgi:hypothetical protein
MKDSFLNYHKLFKLKIMIRIINTQQQIKYNQYQLVLKDKCALLLKTIFSCVFLLILLKSSGQSPTLNQTDSLGQRQGEWCFNDDSLSVGVETYYIDGLENGLRIEYVDHGRIIRESDYKNGKLNGWVRYYTKKQGKLFLMEYYEDDIIKHILMFNKRGRLVRDFSLMNKKIDGQYRAYKRGNIMFLMEEYKNNIQHGKTFHYKKGTRVIEITYDNGKMVGYEKLSYD